MLSIMVDIWKSLVSGPPIDDQKAIRAAITQTVSNEEELPSASSDAQALWNPDDSDDERDPNDVLLGSKPPASGIDPYLDLEDDDW